MSQLNAAQLAAFSVDVYDAADDLLRRLPPGFVRLAEMSNGGLHAVAYLNQATGELVDRVPGGGRAAIGLHQPLVGDRDRRHGLQRGARLRRRRRARKPRRSSGLVLTDGDVTLTGHGVGGGFASLLSVATGLEAVTFNGLRIGGLMSALEERFGTLAAGLCQPDRQLRRHS